METLNNKPWVGLSCQDGKLYEGDTVVIKGKLGKIVWDAPCFLLEYDGGIWDIPGFLGDMRKTEAIEQVDMWEESENS